ncbi:hypothetical protein L2747_02980 [Shewanella marinintestina]|uniref:hypothetical protein n=1 Tax=Shewanella marinintestina TaxID=190305 RepID=UPI002010B32F|nr:hypothetical protein [Shewanella marinintestina]MCL1144977.1 hypothetical protein [Shewanella marinintestina]
MAVLGLSLVAEHVSPKVAGILSGYPLGTAIALFYIGLEISPEFAASSAIYTLAGFSASLVLVCSYYYTSALLLLRVKVTNGLNCFLSTIAAVSSFLIAAYLISLFSFTLSISFILSLLAVLVFGGLLSKIRDAEVDDKLPITFKITLFRAVTAALIVLIVTGIAKVVNENWAGVLSAFPITLLPFLMIIHLSYGSAKAHTIIKHYPFGLGALMIYAASIAYLYPKVGLIAGTVVSFILATLYLLLLASVQHYIRAYRRRNALP